VRGVGNPFDQTGRLELVRDDLNVLSGHAFSSCQIRDRPIAGIGELLQDGSLSSRHPEVLVEKVRSVCEAVK